MSHTEIDADVIIIGAGLSGLASALLLIEAGKSVRIAEARGVPGGRIRSVLDDDTGAYLADFGPTWIWPAFQPVISRWIEKLELGTFPQFDTGKAVLDYGPGTGREIRFVPGQEGNVRVVGGAQAIIDSLAARLPDSAILTNSPVRSVSTTDEGVTLEIENEKTVLKCGNVIVAVPPRIAAKSIIWTPELPVPLSRALEQIPTWMAPHAKAVVFYDKPFWRSQGLPGRIASQAGPIVEGHDHCGPDGSPAALFGFIGWPHDLRAEAGAELKAQICAQLKRCFGPDSPDPRKIHIEDWAADSHVATPRDLAEPISHPDVGPDILRDAHANGRVWFAASETAIRSPGLVEGAFDAAEQTVATLLEMQ